MWLAKDCKTDLLVNLKVHKSGPQFLEAAFDECEILQGMIESMVSEEWNKEMYQVYKSKAYVNEGFVAKILNCFVHFGPNGNHFCIVMEVLGPTLQDVLDESEANGLDVKYHSSM